MPNPIQMNQVGNKIPKAADPKPGDVLVPTQDANPPQRPSVNRAFCFDHITNPDTHVVPQPPPPAPNPPPRRDPFLLELGNIELGSRVQLISLSDDPAASFDKGNVFELAFTGYDANARTGTVLLSADEMEKKSISPGERLIIRIIDDNDQASDGVFVHVDPTRWAGGQQIDTKDDAGNAVRLQGAPISFIDGFVKPGAAAAANTKSTFGATLTDTTAPKLLADNVAVKTFQWTKTEAEMFTSLANTAYFANTSPQDGAAWCEKPGNLDTIPIEHRNTVAEMGKDGGKLLAKAIEALMPDKTKAEIMKTPLTAQLFSQIGQTALDAVTNKAGKDTVLVFAQALEPGTRITVQNNSTGTPANAAQNEQQRTTSVRLPFHTGDKVTVQVADGNGIAGEPYSFEYDAGSRNGKRAEKGGTYKSPLDLQMSLMAKRTIKLNAE